VCLSKLPYFVIHLITTSRKIHHSAFSVFGTQNIININQNELLKILTTATMTSIMMTKKEQLTIFSTNAATKSPTNRSEVAT